MVQFRNHFKFGTDLWDPSHRYETSWLLSPYALCAFRAIFGIYGITTEVFITIWYCTHPSSGGCFQAADNFSYFTVLTYWSLSLYNLTSALHTFTYARTANTNTNTNHTPLPLLSRLPRPLQALHAFHHTTVTTYPFIVTAVYWAAIYPGPTWFPTAFEGWSNTSQHALNSAFALFDIAITRTPFPPWVHLPWLLVVLALYLALAYVTYYTKGFYPYSFLDVQAQGSAVTAGWIVAIAVAGVVVFCLVRGLLWVRIWLTETRGRLVGRPAVAVGLGSVADVEMGRFRDNDAKSAGPVSVTNSNEF